MHNVLVTGATGFVGRALCGRLLAERGAVRCAVRRAGSAVCLPAGVDTLSIGSIGPDTDWLQALAGIDTVVHLAARVHVMNETAEDSLAAYRSVNVAGTETLARMAVANGVRRLVYLSSVKVHGEETNVPYTEDDQPAPSGPYGISKLEAEEVLAKVAAETGLEVVIIRPPLVYGPGVKANFLCLMNIVERGIPLPLTNINNKRSLVHLGNLVDAIVTCATDPRATGQAFLVSDDEDISTPELIQRVATAMGRPARLFPFPLSLMRLAGRLTGKSAAVDRLLGSLRVDSGKIQRVLGWKPPFTMEEGLHETAAWYKSFISAR